MFNNTATTSIDQIVQAASNARKSREALVTFLKGLAVEHGIKPKEIFEIGQGGTMPTRYYDPISGKGWTGNGSAPSDGLKAARAFDKENPNAMPKRLDQYLIPDGEQGKLICLKLKKDVRTASKVIIKFADLSVEASNQPNGQIPA